MKKQEKSIAYFRNNFNCSQSVFTVFGTETGMPEDECLKVACAFGGGMGRQQYICGAVTGALMALGLKYGKGSNDQEDKKKHTYTLAAEFLEEFKRIHGSLNCRELLDDLNMNDSEDYKTIKERNFFEIRCENYVKDAVTITEKLIEKGRV
jgi:C_GCAxxG_C_C family probable redox protein